MANRENPDIEGEIKLVSLYYKDNAKYLWFSTFVIAMSGYKVIYTYAHKVAAVIPESNMLLLFGMGVGLLMNWFHKDFAEQVKDVFSINAEIFFHVLLPPIILESSFCIYHKTFASNIVGVLVFAVIATVLNFFFIGLGLTTIAHLKAIQLSTPHVNKSTFWVFSSLIVAVDPVAVLAIFQEIQVDNNLYYLVFGESLLNDGVSVVLYEVMTVLSTFDTITINEIVRAFLAFFFVGIGGGLIGCVISILTCIITRFTFKTPLTEPLFVIFFGYLSYLIANLIKWSGIISMIVYGVFQATYGFQNITQKSLILIKRLSKVLSNLSEAIIFLSLGVSVTNVNMNFMSTFTFWSLFLCLYGRFIFTLLLSSFINYFEFNIRKIAWNEQFIIAYGGLRGGIAYCLAALIEPTLPISRLEIQETTIFITIFTIFFMGTTMRPLVRMLNIKIAKPDELSLFVQISESAIDHLLAGMEEVIGMKGRNSLHEFMTNIDELYIKPFLQRDPLGREEKIMKVFEKMNLTIHMATTSAAGTQMSAYYLKKLKPQIRQWTMENFARPETYTSMHGSINLKPLEPNKTTPHHKNIKIVDNPTFTNLFSQHRSSDIHVDHSRFAHRMSAMLYRKRRSIALGVPKDFTTRNISTLSRFTNESETDMLTLEFKRKRH